MIKITKSEMMYLQKMGYQFGDTIHKDASGHGHYWMTTDMEPMKALTDYRANHVLSTYK